MARNSSTGPAARLLQVSEVAGAASGGEKQLTWSFFLPGSDVRLLRVLEEMGNNMSR